MANVLHGSDDFNSSVMINRCYLEICYTCNNRCVSCPIRGDKRILPFREIKDFIEQKARKDATVVITGGEPTIHPDFIPILEYAAVSESGRKVILLTNGRKFSDMEFARSAIKTGLDDICIALNGPRPEIHDRITGSPGSFVQTVAGIKNLFQLKLQGIPLIIKLKLLVSRINIKYLTETIRFVTNEFPRPDYLYIEIIDLLHQAAKNKQALLIRLKDTVPYIAEAVQNGLSHRQNILLLDIPPCLFPEPSFYYQLFFHPAKETPYIYGPLRGDKNSGSGEMNVKAPGCGECEIDEFCGGVWRSYAEMCGLDELKPIKRLKAPAWLKPNTKS